MCLSEEIPPSEANALLDAEAGGVENSVSCSHWLLDTSSGGLRPEDEVPCPKCHKTRGTLLLDCLSSEPLTSHTAYCCSTGTPVNHFLVHGASKVCPHCNQPRQDHVASMLSRICIAVLATTHLYVPPDEQRNREEFNSRAVLWACHQTYPDQVLLALSNWLSSVTDNQVEGEVIDFGRRQESSWRGVRLGLPHNVEDEETPSSLCL